MKVTAYTHFCFDSYSTTNERTYKLDFNDNTNTLNTVDIHRKNIYTIGHNFCKKWNIESGSFLTSSRLSRFRTLFR